LTRLEAIPQEVEALSSDPAGCALASAPESQQC
jgi:hypothetical protein